MATIEEWQILDTKVVANTPDGGALLWYLIADDSVKGCSWRPFQVDGSGKIIAEPHWAPLPGAQYVALTAPIFELLMDGNRGDITDDMPVMTDSGWKRADSVTMTDRLLAPDGSFTELEAILPQGVRPVYRLTFDDGATVDASPDHLWLTWDGKCGGRDGWLVKTTQQIVDHKSDLYVPLMSEPAPGDVWGGADPYICGLILGDGTLTGRHVTVYGHAEDEQEKEYLRRAGFTVKQYRPNCFQAYQTEAQGGEKWRDVLGRCTGDQKCVPRELLEADPATRLAVLQGLMDADGTVCKEGRSSFVSCSKHLAEAVQYIVRSLGGKATLREKHIRSGLGGRHRVWHVQVMPCNKFAPFRLQRKLDRLKPMKGLKRKVCSIERLTDAPTRCFRVKHPGHLFVTKDFVVTHNSGKSELLLMDYARDVGKGYGAAWRGILFRKQLGDLDEMVRKAETLFGAIYGNKFRFLHSKADYRCVWDSGEELLFRHLANVDEYQEYHGHQYPWIGFEELTQWEDDKPYKKMFSCCRPTAQGVPTRIRANTNPSGVGHNWVKKRFKLPNHHGRVIREPAQEPRVAIRLDLKENFVLLHTDPGYINRIRAAASSPAEAKAWADGDWDVTFGGMFDDIWDSNVHVVPDIRPLAIPRGWRLSRSYDHGQSKPFASLWWAESNGEPLDLPGGRRIGQVRGDLVLFKEWYGTNGEENTGVRMLASKIAEGIRDRERDWGIAGYVNPGPADTEIWSRDNRGTGRAPIDDFEGVLGYDCWEKADKSPGSRKRGWQQVREYMQGAKPGPDGTRESPGLFVCEGCVHWLELVPPTPRSPKDNDEIPDSYEDHLGDATRYRVTWQHSFMGQGHF